MVDSKDNYKFDLGVKRLMVLKSGHSVIESVCKSVNQSVCQSISQSVSQSVSQLVSYE